MNIIETGDGSGTLFSERYNETFHSTNGAVTESRHVFLDACGVSERLRAGQSTRVLEIGFGLGLNGLITADTALRHGTPLDYHSIEHDAGMLNHAQRLNYDAFLHDPTLGATMRQVLANQTKCSSKTVIDLGEDVTVRIHWENAVTSISAGLLGGTLPRRSFSRCESDPDYNGTSRSHSLDSSGSSNNADGTDSTDSSDCLGLFNAVYLDAFSPDTNPECWSETFFRSLKPLMAVNGHLSTYSAKGTVRRALQAAGFTVNKIAGPPGKREMMVAHL